MTSAWSKGRNSYYPYYFCHQKACSEYRKSIRRDAIEGEFENLLHTLKPSPKLFELFHMILSDVWHERGLAAKTRQSTLKAELAKIEKSIDQVMDRIVASDNPKLISAYEDRIEKLEEEKAIMRESAENAVAPIATFGETFRTACEFLANPWKLWTSELLEHKRMLLRLVFPERIAYDRKTGLRTAAIAQPLKLFGTYDVGEFGVVGPEGLEPPARPL